MNVQNGNEGTRPLRGGSGPRERGCVVSSRLLRVASLPLFAAVLIACAPPPPPPPVQLIPPTTRIACNATKSYTGPERCVRWHDSGGDVEGPYWMGAVQVANGGHWITKP